jgi:hypothetical protein
MFLKDVQDCIKQFVPQTAGDILHNLFVIFSTNVEYVSMAILHTFLTISLIHTNFLFHYVSRCEP